MSAYLGGVLLLVGFVSGVLFCSYLYEKGRI
jgi:hypothetical protein